MQSYDYDFKEILKIRQNPTFVRNVVERMVKGELGGPVSLPKHVGTFFLSKSGICRKFSGIKVFYDPA